MPGNWHARFCSRDGGSDSLVYCNPTGRTELVPCLVVQAEVRGSSAPAAELRSLSRLRRLNGARDGPLSGGRRRRPNPSMERTSSLRLDVAALAPCSSRRATGAPTPRGVPLISRLVRRQKNEKDLTVQSRKRA